MAVVFKTHNKQTMIAVLLRICYLCARQALEHLRYQLTHVAMSTQLLYGIKMFTPWGYLE